MIKDSNDLNRLAGDAAEGAGLRPNAVWSITLRDGGFDLLPAMGDFDALVEGSSVDLLLVIVRRRSIGEAALEVTGGTNLVDFWLANTAFD